MKNLCKMLLWQASPLSPKNLAKTVLLIPVLILFATLSAQNLLDRVKQNDANDDGRVTREEFRGPAEVFKRIDANNDGVIDADEMGRIPHTAGGSPTNSGGRAIPQNLEVLSNIAYAVQSEAQKLDLIRDKTRSPGPSPLVVFIHGGGWKSGDKRPFPALFEKLVEAGFVCASINYRLSGEAKFPTQAVDCKTAIRYLRAKSGEFGIDPERIGVWGSSAGGHLSAFLGATGDLETFKKGGDHISQSDRVQAVCDFFGPTDFLKMKGYLSRIDHMGEDSPESELLGGSVEKNPEAAKSASPLTYLDAGDPPFLIMHGDKDELVPISQSELLFEALKAKGVTSRFVVVTNGGHGFRGPEIEREVVDFFKITLAPTKIKLNGSAPAFPKGIFVSGPPTGPRGSSIVPELQNKDFVDGFLVRIGWKDLEKSRGQFDWTLLDSELETARKLGKKVALGIVNGPHAPTWLDEAGVPSVEITGRGRTTRTLVPWDPAHLSAWTNFVKQLGIRAGKHPSLALVHITHSTLNGFEMPLSFTPEQEQAWKGSGFTKEKWLTSWQAVITSFADAFPSTPLDVEVHPVFKDDSLPAAVVDYGFKKVPGRFGVFGAWWSDRNTAVYSGCFDLLKRAAGESFAAVQMVASQTPNRFGPPGGIGEGGLAKAFETGLFSGIRYFEVWETDLQNPELEPFFISMKKKCLE